jgi:sugar phosphate isomerase/epimerase
MKYGIIHYNAPGATLEEFLQYAKDTGFGYVELQVRDVWNPEQGEPEPQAEAAQKLLDKLGLQASALSSGNDFVVLEEEAVKAQVERMERICKLAQIIGTNVIRTEGGAPKDSVPEAKWADAIVGCLERCREFIEPMNIHLAVDNHGVVTNNGDLQLEVFKRVGSRNVGANMDTMNYRWFGNDLPTCERYYKEIAPYTFHTHLKDGSGSRGEYKGAALGEGEINLKYAVKCLQEAGYEGAWTAEYEGKEERGVGYAKCLAWMKANIPG